VIASRAISLLSLFGLLAISQLFAQRASNSRRSDPTFWLAAPPGQRRSSATALGRAPPKSRPEFRREGRRETPRSRLSGDWSGWRAWE
jgi:hypothetical protein